MDSKDENMELINEAIKRLLEERKNSKSSAGEGVSQGGGDDDDGDKDEDRLLLHRLLSQVRSPAISTSSLSISPRIVSFLIRE